MYKFFVFTAWSAVSLVCLGVCTSTLHYLAKTRQSSQALAANSPLPQSHYPSNSGAIQGITTHMTAEDARPYIIAQFLERYQSPLTPYQYWGEYLTQTADKYGLDFRLLPAIAMQESNLCKKIPENTYNCLGLGIHARGTWGFDSFEANFDKAAEILRRHYVDQGLITPDDIQDKYTPSSNGSWEFSVNSFMDKLETAEF